MTFRFIIPGGPCGPYIARCLESLNKQTSSDWTAQVVLDPVPGDNAPEVAKTFESEKIRVHVNDTQQYALANLLKAAELQKPEDDDVLIQLDGDDWLPAGDVVDILGSYYRGIENLLVTYGSWTPYPPRNVPQNSYAYTKDDFDKGVRKVAWRATALRSMKYKVWRSIKDEDLRDTSGNYFQVAWDLALMWPALEMAGFDRVRFIPQVLYVYNQETPHNDMKLRVREQMAFTQYLASKSPYKYRETF